MDVKSREDFAFRGWEVILGEIRWVMGIAMVRIRRDKACIIDFLLLFIPLGLRMYYYFLN